MKERFIKALGGATQKEMENLNKRVDTLSKMTENNTRTLNILAISMLAETTVSLITSAIKNRAASKSAAPQIQQPTPQAAPTAGKCDTPENAGEM